MQPTSDDKLAASVFATGLMLGFVRREDVVRWADRRIMELDAAPPWLIDVSLSQHQNVMDLISELKELGKGTDVEAVCKTILGMLPDMKGLSFDEAEAVAKRIYETTRHCIGDWNNPLLAEADAIDDTFALVRRGILTQQEAVDQLTQFVERYRDGILLNVISPAVWSAPFPRNCAGSQNDVRQPLIDVGLSAWIIQDGNYGDFAVGQEAKFALEFYPPHVLQRAQEGLLVAERLTGNRYRVRGRVVFADPQVWVIDAGTFMAFSEHQPPPHAIVGTLVEGEVYLGIDPFFYFEYLHRMEGMPPLTYTWTVREIMRETTPWIEGKDAQGRACRSRDKSQEAFVTAGKTRAWDEDAGHANYVLVCERITGPERP